MSQGSLFEKEEKMVPISKHAGPHIIVLHTDTVPLTN